jgi:signal transduction histidine kinase
MQPSDILRAIRQPWLDRVEGELKAAELNAAIFPEEANRFFGLLIETLESGDPGWLNPVLIDWAASRKESDLREDAVTLSPALKIMSTALTETAREQLSSDQAAELLSALVPLMYYAYEKTAEHEVLVRSADFSARLEQKTSDLTNLDRSKSDFISVAAHELKTPLTLIEGYSSMLQDVVNGTEVVEEATTLLNGIKTGIQRLAEIVNDMIDVSMIDNEMLSLRFQPTWINRILDTLMQELRPVTRSRNQEFSVIPFEGFEQMIFADPERIQQAIRNVLVNAIKYTPDGGSITVEGRELSGFLEIIITDTGIGILPENQVRVFEKFSSLGDARLHSSSKTNFKGGGPGLGLPISKGIVVAHGGSIWVESDGYDEETLPGCTFHLVIPMRKEMPDENLTRLFRTTNQKERMSNE